MLIGENNMYYEKLVHDLNIAADKWEKENPFIPTGALRVHDALRAAADALSESDPVRHGYWKDYGYYLICSLCDNEIDRFNDHECSQNFPYCPYCGARMNEETKNE